MAEYYQEYNKDSGDYQEPRCSYSGKEFLDSIEIKDLNETAIDNNELNETTIGNEDSNKSAEQEDEVDKQFLNEMQLCKRLLTKLHLAQEHIEVYSIPKAGYYSAEVCEDYERHKENVTYIKIEKYIHNVREDIIEIKKYDDIKKEPKELQDILYKLWDFANLPTESEIKKAVEIIKRQISYLDPRGVQQKYLTDAKIFNELRNCMLDRYGMYYKPED